MPFTHIRKGMPVMVDVSAKPESRRSAAAESSVRLTAKTMRALRGFLRRRGGLRKGDPVSVAVLAGIQAAKRTSEIIPLCHPIRIDSIQVEPSVSGRRVVFCATCVTTGRTGVEMEALTAAACAALALYDMLKSVDRGNVIERVRLLSKSGGRSGTYTAARTRGGK